MAPLPCVLRVTSTNQPGTIHYSRPSILSRIALSPVVRCAPLFYGYWFRFLRARLRFLSFYKVFPRFSRGFSRGGSFSAGETISGAEQLSSLFCWVNVSGTPRLVMIIATPPLRHNTSVNTRHVRRRRLHRARVLYTITSHRTTNNNRRSDIYPTNRQQPPITNCHGRQRAITLHGVRYLRRLFHTAKDKSDRRRVLIARREHQRTARGDVIRTNYQGTRLGRLVTRILHRGT